MGQESNGEFQNGQTGLVVKQGRIDASEVRCTCPSSHISSQAGGGSLITQFHINDLGYSQD